MKPILLQGIFCYVFFLITYNVQGQTSPDINPALESNYYFQIPGRIKTENGDPSGVVIRVLSQDSMAFEQSMRTTSSGKFQLHLNYFSKYQVSFSKEGYYSKIIDISTIVPLNVWVKDRIFPPFYVIFTLYKIVPNTKLSFEGETIGKISYSPNGGLDNFDSVIFCNDDEIINEINSARKSAENKESGI